MPIERPLAFALLTIISAMGTLVASKAKTTSQQTGSKPNCDNASLTINPNDSDSDGGVSQKSVTLCEDQTIAWTGKNFEVVFESSSPFRNGALKFTTTQADVEEKIAPCIFNPQNCGTFTSSNRKTTSIES